ncbi:MAG TPA: hypothetical protein VH089_06300 [Streptosporangiaceae bacterium]|jgi:hypothetical protein|nr:hypothetical protein [Streptosporangiaceae bacterium]
MNASNPSTPRERLRQRWASPPRSGLRLILSPWEYRHLRVGAGLHFGGAVVLAGLGFVTLGFGGGTGKAVAWSLVFLLPAAANLATALWELSIANSAAA